LAVGTGGGGYAKDFPNQNVQGMLYTVAPKVKNWTKAVVNSEKEGKELTFSFANKPRLMYEASA
jgi:hypothetical protein